MNFSEIERMLFDIEGWMDPPDIKWLFNMAKTMEHNSLVVEVGSWKGRSSSSIYSGLNSDNFYCVDTWMGPTGHPNIKSNYPDAGHAAYSDFLANVKRVCSRIPFVIKGDSSKSSCLFEDGSVDWVFIDANHSYDFAKRDIESWIPKVKQNGIVSGHDWEHPEVKKALKSLVDPKKIEVSGCNIWWFRK